MPSIKRSTDIIISSFFLLVLSPLLLMTGIIIKVTMPGPLFFRQQRVGMHQKLFDILKFRSMKVDRSAEESFDFDKDEQRITTFGRLIRRLKIDELPQLLNVLRGDMSLVGPRPTIKQQVADYDAHQRRRLDVKPGMTGLAQVNGNTYLTWEERIEYDIEYVNSHSLKLDMLIILKTILIVLFGEGNFKKTERKISKG